MTFKRSIKEILRIYCVHKLFFSGFVFICLHRQNCLKGLMHGSSLNKTIITRFQFSFLSVIDNIRLMCIYSPLAVLVIAFSQLIKVKKLLEAARVIFSRLSPKMSSTASAPLLGQVDEEMEEVESEEEQFDPPNATLLKAEGEVVVRRITTKKFRADPWPRVLEADLDEAERSLCSSLSRMKIEEKGKRMELITQRRTVTRSIEVQCELGGSSLFHLPRFDASLPVETSAPKFNVITYVGDVEQQQPQQPSEDQQERAGAADVRVKDHQQSAIAKAQEERRHTVATPDNLQITVTNKRKDQQQQDLPQQPSTSKPAAPARKAQKIRPELQLSKRQQRQQQRRDERRHRQEQQQQPQQQPLLTARAQKRHSDEGVVPLVHQIQHQPRQRGRQHQQQDALQQRPAQGEKRRPPSRQPQQPSPAPKRRAERVVKSGNPPPQVEEPQPQLSRSQKSNNARKRRKITFRQRQNASGGASTQVDQEHLPESGNPQVPQPPSLSAPNPAPDRVSRPPGVVVAHSSQEAPTEAGQGQGELAVNQQPANYSQRAGPRLQQPARSAAPPMTPSQVAPRVPRQRMPAPTVRMPVHPLVPSFPPPRPFVNSTILSLPTQSVTNSVAQIQPAQSAPIQPSTSTPAPQLPAASQHVFGGPAMDLFSPQQLQSNINQQHTAQLQQMADVYTFERQRARAAIEQYVASTRGAGLIADSFRNVAQDTSVVAPLPTLPPFPLLPPSQARQSFDVASMANTLTAYQMALQQRVDLFAALPAAVQPPPVARQPDIQAALFNELPPVAAAQPPPPERRTELDFVRAALFGQLPFPEMQPPPPGDAPGPQ